MALDIDPYAWHAVILAYGGSREELAKLLNEMAVEVARGGNGWRTSGASGVLLVRQSDDSGGEEAREARMTMVCATEGDGDPIAMFADAKEARRYIAGDPVPEERSNVDMCSLRADVVLSLWNSVDPDPHAGVNRE